MMGSVGYVSLRLGLEPALGWPAKLVGVAQPATVEPLVQAGDIAVMSAA